MSSFLWNYKVYSFRQRITDLSMRKGDHLCISALGITNGGSLHLIPKANLFAELQQGLLKTLMMRTGKTMDQPCVCCVSFTG